MCSGFSSDSILSTDVTAVPLANPNSSLPLFLSSSSHIILLQNAKKREALDAAQAKKKSANFTAVVPDRDWTEEEKQVRDSERRGMEQIEG